ncbi:TonB-dependent receptor [Gallaecimonas mangrovi]|uniref:TonB-dependent receptor n=1 Tax=Gallaecimonas mangrovi TaxID=2291597 RepID=UPI000E1FF338|nr:TonB-dependent receptor [Gallaecimonas mangrovi]
MKYSKLYIALLGLGCFSLSASVLAADSVDVGKVTVKGKGQESGQMVQQDSGKTRSTVTKKALEEQSGTGNGIDKLQYTPGINVVSNDATGLSGFSFNMRGMDASQVGVTMDGVPVNDSGNYAMYPNLLGDPENLEEIFATQGSSDTDAPHIGSSGGNIGLVSMRPTKDFNVFAKQVLGSNSLTKSFMRVNTGDINGFRTYLSFSKTKADKWKGEGEIEAKKAELNTLWQDDKGNSVNAIVKWHKQEANSYATVSLGEYQENHKADYDSNYSTCTADNGAEYICSSYYKLAQNPFENITASVTGRFQLTNNLLLTVAPYYYVANGGGSSAYSLYSLNSGTYNSGGNYDLSNLGSATDYQEDGNLTSGYYYRPSWTETWRPGINTKLTWTINMEHSLDFGYWYEYARQRQSQPYIALNSDGSPSDVWADFGNGVKDANGNTIEGRYYRTDTPAQKVFVQDTWYTTPDLTLTYGVSYEHVERKGDNLGSLTEEPEKRNATYSKALPSFNAKYSLDAESSVYYSLTRNMRTPQNYVLYDTEDSLSLAPEMSWNHELGYRYGDNNFSLSASAFYLSFTNRQVSSRDEDGDYEMLNVGTVHNIGGQFELSGVLPYGFNYYASYTYTKSEQQNDIDYYGVTLDTSGKQVAGVPRQMLNLIFGYDKGAFYGNVAAKMVSSQYGDMLDTEKAAGYGVVNLTGGYRLPQFSVFKDSVIRFTVNNLFDKSYLAGVSSTAFTATKVYSADGSNYASGTPYYTIGEDRNAQISFETKF